MLFDGQAFNAGDWRVDKPHECETAAAQSHETRNHDASLAAATMRSQSALAAGPFRVPVRAWLAHRRVIPCFLHQPPRLVPLRAKAARTARYNLGLGSVGHLPTNRIRVSPGATLGHFVTV